MSIWSGPMSVAEINAACANSLMPNVGIQITNFGDDWLEGTLPLSDTTRDASGSLHPGALAILAETLGSVGANLSLDLPQERCLGQILHVSHPHRLAVGPVLGRAMRVAKTATNQVWRIDVEDATGARVCTSELTLAIVSVP